jgi:hypothetical protein
MLPALIVLGVAVTAAEATLWLLFRHKVANMRFPRTMDLSSFRFFSMRRMQVSGIVHGMLLLLSTLLPVWILW